MQQLNLVASQKLGISKNYGECSEDSIKIYLSLICGDSIHETTLVGSSQSSDSSIES